MGYLQEANVWLETELGRFLQAMEDAESEEAADEAFKATKKLLAEKILESYHNGRNSAKGVVRRGAEGVKRRFTRRSQPRR